MNYSTPKAAIVAAGRTIHMPGVKHTADWSYTNSQGSELMRVARFDFPDGSKEFRPVHVTATGWKIGDPPGLLPLYRIAEIADDEVVWICEGEKATDAARQLGMVAVTSAHGSSAAAKSDWTPLSGRKVCILPDNDDAGRKYARAVATILINLSPAAEVKIVELPGLPTNGDIIEYIQGCSSVPPQTIHDSIIALAANQEPKLSDQLLVQRWPAPLPLPNGLPPVMPFNFEWLPVAVRGWVRDISERMQCPPDYCAATAMIVAGALIGNKVVVRPKQHDDWQVVVNLFGMMVGRPSLMKSPAMKEIMKFPNMLEVKAKSEHLDALEEYETAAMVADAKKLARKKAVKKAVERGADASSIARTLAADDESEPKRRRYVVNDTTVEKLGVILNENRSGVLLFFDELIALLRSMDRDGHEGDRAFYLMAWAGDSRFTYDRIGRGTLDIEAALVSIVGSIQPGVVGEYLRGAITGGRGDDGMMQRFQMTVWPDASPTWTNVDRTPNAAAKERAYAALQNLSELTAISVHAESDDEKIDGLPFLRFNKEAQQIFDRWRATWENKLRSGEEHPAIEAHLTKYRSLIPSLALILHLLDDGQGAISAQALNRALGWASYLESHARRLYAGITESSAITARALAARISKGDVGSMFSARDVYLKCWSGLDRLGTESAIEVLLSLHWLEEVTESTPGRPKTRYAINPQILNAQRREHTEPTEAPFVGFDRSPCLGNAGFQLDERSVGHPQLAID